MSEEAAAGAAKVYEEYREKEILFLLLKNDEARWKQLVEQVKGLIMPEGFTAEVCPVVGGTLGKIGNYAIRRSRARYKLFISDEVAYIDWREIVVSLLQAVERTGDSGMAGLLGSGLPLGGDYLKGTPLVGRHDRLAPGGTMNCLLGDNPITVRRVAALQPYFFVTRVDMDWDEELDGVFALAAQSEGLRRAGYRTVVPKQNYAWCRYHADSVYRQERSAAYEGQLALFRARCPRLAYPLVSILIPAYNQPDYLRQALDSALAQEYPKESLEIIIGDDSTDKRVGELVADYQARFPGLIKYEHHPSPLGGHGLGNMRECVSRASGEYVSFLFHDDLLYPRKLLRMVEAYRHDLSGNLAFVTSARDMVGSEGEKKIARFTYDPRKDRVIPGREVGRTILLNLMNFLGELSTFLLRREDALNFGHYFTLPDHSMWDVSTALELCRRGRYCLFLAEPLSAFRRHEGQNTFNQDVVLDSRLDWLSFLTASWLRDAYLEDEEEFWATCRLYIRSYAAQPIEPEQAEGGKEFDRKYELYRELLRCAGAEEGRKKTGEGDRAAFLDKMIGYMLSFAESPREISRACERGKDGRWRKKES